jgi:hypothetical protein
MRIQGGEGRAREFQAALGATVRATPTMTQPVDPNHVRARSAFGARESL